MKTGKKEIDRGLITSFLFHHDVIILPLAGTYFLLFQSMKGEGESKLLPAGDEG